MEIDHSKGYFTGYIPMPGLNVCKEDIGKFEETEFFKRLSFEMEQIGAKVRKNAFGPSYMIFRFNCDGEGLSCELDPAIDYINSDDSEMKIGLYFFCQDRESIDALEEAGFRYLRCEGCVVREFDRRYDSFSALEVAGWIKTAFGRLNAVKL